MHADELNGRVTALERAAAGGGGAATQSYTLATDESTSADTTPVSLTDLAFNFEAGATYAFRFVGNVSPAAATTGCGFQMLIT